MIMRQNMLNVQALGDVEFWSDIYRERPIAIFNHHGYWRVYLDHVLQKALFATSEDAVLWLTQRIDHGVPARLH
jgi:hypothetical protein